MKSLLGGTVVATVVLASSPARADVVIEVDGLDAERVRDGIGRELGSTVTGTLTVTARDGILTVSFLRANAGAPVTRILPLAAHPETTAILIAGNLARDEAGELVGVLKAPPPPRPEQVVALKTLEDGVSAYERGAKDYRDAMASIARLYYEVKKQSALAGVDQRLRLRHLELDKARAVAIQRHEQLIAAHASDPNWHEAPDAMHRLAILYEERSQRLPPSAAGLVDAVRVYQRIIDEYPGYHDIETVRRARDRLVEVR